METALSQSWHNAEHYWTLQFDSSLNDLDVHSKNHRVRGKLELVQSFFLMLHEAAQMFMIVDYVSPVSMVIIEYLLFLFLCCQWWCWFLFSSVCFSSSF